MPRDQRNEASIQRITHEQLEEAEALLAPSLEEEENAPSHSAPPRRIALPERRQSSISKPPPNGQPRTPRTSNRVRFDIEERRSREYVQNGNLLAENDASREGWVEEEDYLSSHAHAHPSRTSSTGQRAPLLTDIEAPSVTVASSDVNFNVEDLLETARPKSGMRSAFMNMANSIM